MRYRPTDGELLEAIALLLEDHVLGSVGPELRHQVRVAANLVRILQRQSELEPSALERERASLAGLLGREGTLAELRETLDERLQEATGDDPEAWAILMATARDDLAVAKPGYDEWEGE
ncbi:MAG: DUF6285 domain-containing protein [Acidimicrobiales bacterium]